MQIWEDNSGDTIKLEEIKGVWYGAGNSFDFERATESEATEQLKAWGYELVGWE